MVRRCINKIQKNRIVKAPVLDRWTVDSSRPEITLPGLFGKFFILIFIVDETEINFKGFSAKNNLV